MARLAAEFVHLHVHSEFSILDGASPIPDLAGQAAEFEMPAVALTDHGSLAGAIQLYQHAQKAGVKPLIGCEVYVCEDASKQEKGYAHLTLLAESNEGYGNLIKLASAGYLQGYYKPRVDWNHLAGHAKGSSRSPDVSPVASARRSRRTGPRTPPDLDRLTQVFGRDNVYVEIQNAGLQEQARIPRAAALAAQTGLPLVATGDVHYLRHEDAKAHEALLCIQSGDSLKNPSRWKFDTDQFFFKSPAEMAASCGVPGGAPRDARRRRAAERRDPARRDPPTEVPGPRGPRRVRLPRRALRKRPAKRYGTVTPELNDRLRSS